METKKVTVTKGMTRERRRICEDCGQSYPHYVLPKIYHNTLLPEDYTETGYLCDNHLAMDAAYHERMAETIKRELRRREQVLQQAGY